MKFTLEAIHLIPTTFIWYGSLKIYEPHKGINAMDLGRFIIDFQDHLAPKLDTYEQAIYLYIFRHSRLTGKEDVVIGFKSARARVACGVGQKGKPISDNSLERSIEYIRRNLRVIR